MNLDEQFKQECIQEITLQNDPALWAKAHNFIFDPRLKKYTHHFRWMGRPVIQFPQDIVAYQELLWSLSPDLIIETGIAHGGSLVLSASILALLEYADAAKNGVTLDPAAPKRFVLGIDIDIREHNRKAIEQHPMASRIRMIEGSSTDETTAAQVCAFARNFRKVLVCLDSNHTHDHVLRELQLYAKLASPGSYCIVWDTSVEDGPADVDQDRPWNKYNNPKTAVWEFLKQDKTFEVDHTVQNKLLITAAKDGYLKRKE